MRRTALFEEENLDVMVLFILIGRRRDYDGGFDRLKAQRVIDARVRKRKF
jgi:hypothetical protein